MITSLLNNFVSKTYAAGVIEQAEINSGNEITNRSLTAEIASKSPSEGLAFYVATLWRTVVILGGVAFIIFLIWGGIEWLTAGGDKTKVETAQKMISNAVIGLAILVASYAITIFIQNTFKINILQPVFPNNI